MYNDKKSKKSAMINIFEPNVGDGSVELLSDVFKSNWLGRGTYVNEFETLLAQTLKTDKKNIHTIACCTDAIFGVFDIYDLPPNSEVLVPSISFPAVGSAIIAARLIPKIIDIDLSTGNVNFDAVEKHLSKKTSAIFVTHYGGIPVDIQKLRSIVGPEVLIFEDAACAFGTSVDGVACGTEGDFGCWSFDAMKLLTCGEGGAFFISDQARMLKAKEHFYLGLPSQTKSGIDRQATDSRWWEYQLNSPGRRSIFTNINAAIGLPQFSLLEDSLLRRKKIRDAYTETLNKLGIAYLKQDQNNVSYSNYFFTLRTDKRDNLAQYLKDNGVYSTFRYYPLHLIDLFKANASECKVAMSFSETALNIPIHHGMSDDDVSKVCQSLVNFFGGGV